MEGLSPLANEGGGASRTTDPAAGTSAATDVSLRELVSVELRALDRHLTSELKSLRELIQTQRSGDQDAIKKAFDASQELAAKHNDLIHTMEKKDATYATKTETDRLASWQSRLAGGLIVLGFIGVVNLTKLWFG